MLDIVMPIIIAGIIVIVLSVVFRNKKKTDKGFQFNYFALSYRRKMIRTMLNIPIIVIMLLFLKYIVNWSVRTTLLIGLILFIALFGQIIYNYMMWKKVEA